MPCKDLLILLTNDDGFGAQGLVALEEELAGLGRIVVVAPYEEKSGVSHAVTIHYPIRILEDSKDHFSLTGTPADCVIFALSKILPREPDLVVSGINYGPNLGDDIHYSGTVAAAREAALHRIPAMAVSLATRDEDIDFRPAARFARRLIQDLYPQGFSRGGFLNVNVPKGKANGFRFTRQGTKFSSSAIEEKRDPRGRKYYWIGHDEGEWLVEPETDYQAIRDQVISVTPLHRDHTDYRALKQYGEKTGV
jgi:5'-nucleotidase